MEDFTFERWLVVQNDIMAASLALTAALQQGGRSAEELRRLHGVLLAAREVSDALLAETIAKRESNSGGAGRP